MTKLPNYFRTWGLFKRVGNLENFSFGKLASTCGVELASAEAWGREPASNENPNGSGRKNPADCVIRIIGKVHKEDRALAREIAEMFPDYLDYLDGMHPDADLSVIERAGLTARDSGELVFQAVKDGDTEAIVHAVAQLEEDCRELKRTAIQNSTRALAAKIVTNGGKRG